MTKPDRKSSSLLLDLNVPRPIMADISGLVLTVLGLSFKVASAIYSYSNDVKDAKGDIQQLSNEIFALIGVLEQLKVNQEQISTGKWTDHSKAFSQDSNRGSLRHVLQKSLEFLQDLHKRLESPKTRFKAKIQKLKWPFEQKETTQHLQRLERVKTYLILSLMTDEMFASISSKPRVSFSTNNVQRSDPADCIRDIVSDYSDSTIDKRTTERRTPYIFSSKLSRLGLNMCR